MELSTYLQHNYDFKWLECTKKLDRVQTLLNDHVYIMWLVASLYLMWQVASVYMMWLVASTRSSAVSSALLAVSIAFSATDGIRPSFPSALCNILRFSTSPLFSEPTGSWCCWVWRSILFFFIWDVHSCNRNLTCLSLSGSSATFPRLNGQLLPTLSPSPVRNPQSPPIICHAPTVSRRKVMRSYPTRWQPRLGENGKRWVSKFSLNNITQILLHIKDYNIWNSFSLTDMRLFPQKQHNVTFITCSDLVTVLPLHLPLFADWQIIKFG